MATSAKAAKRKKKEATEAFSSKEGLPKDTLELSEDASDRAKKKDAAVDSTTASKKQRRKALAKEKDEAERLQRILFGNLDDPSSLAFGLELQDDVQDGVFEGQHIEQDVEEHLTSTGDGDAGRKPVWEDEEEAHARVKLSNVNRLRKLLKVGERDTVSGKEYVARLRAFHSKLNPGNSWAELPSERKKRKKKKSQFSDSDEENDDGELSDAESEIDIEDGNILLKNTELVSKSKTRLLPGLIGISRLQDANFQEAPNAVIQSVEFHKNAELLLTAGFDKRLRLFQIDGKRNPKVQSVYLDDFPIQKAAFVPDGSGVVASARRKFYYSYNLQTGMVEKMDPLIGREEKSLESFELSPDSKTVAFLGNDGYILLTSLRTKQFICSLKMNGSVRAVSFTRNGRELLSSGDDGEVYHWDIGTRRCIHKGRDEGCIKSTALTVSRDSRLFATGSGSGVVNLYEREKFLKGEISPAKTFMNLLTTVDNLKFNTDSQILAMSSRMKRNALRLVHLPSYTVFSNWPTANTPLQYVHSLDFSPGGGYLAAGNAAGKVLLFRLQHYDHA